MSTTSSTGLAPLPVLNAVKDYLADLSSFFADKGLTFTATCQIAAATSADNPVWTVSVDPNKSMFVGSALKSFILADFLRDKRFDIKTTTVEINDDVRSIVSPVFGDQTVSDPRNLELNGTTMANSALEAMIAHSDNTATDAILKLVGVDNVRKLIADLGLDSVKLTDSTRRMFTWLAARKDVQVSWQQLLDYYHTQPNPQSPINSRQTMMASAADLVRWYQIALQQPGFFTAAQLHEFKRISAMADGVWRVVPDGIAAYGKGGSIMWNHFGAISLAGQMVVPTRDPSLPAWMPVTFSFQINWNSDDKDIFNQVGALLGRDGNGILQASLDSFYWAQASHTLTVNAETIHGSSARDLFSGPGGGLDQLYGAAGNDTFEIRAAQTGLIDGGTGEDTVRAIDATLDSGLVFSHVERLEATTASLAATRAQLAQFGTIVATAGGATFTVLLQGAGGVVDFSTRYASAPELGIDATAATSRVTLIGTSGNDRLTGSAFDDVLFGGPGDDVLAGGGGFDTVSYAKVTRWMRVDLETGVAIGEGRDTLNGIEAVIGSDFNDSLRGDALGNALYGGVGDDQIWGRAGDDRLFGGDGADVLYGGLGADRLTGGAGPDTFLFRALAESTLAGDGRDRIMDFDQAGGDLIDLRDIDANLRAAGDQAFTFIGSAPFSGTPGELRTALIGTTTVLMGDVNGDRVAELAISLDGAPPLTASGLLL